MLSTKYYWLDILRENFLFAIYLLFEPQPQKSSFYCLSSSIRSFVYSKTLLFELPYSTVRHPVQSSSICRLFIDSFWLFRCVFQTSTPNRNGKLKLLPLWTSDFEVVAVFRKVCTQRAFNGSSIILISHLVRTWSTSSTSCLPCVPLPGCLQMYLFFLNFEI